MANWATIPDKVKDSDAFWYADYFNVIAFAVSSISGIPAPDDWSDLVKPAFRNAIALTGEPQRTNEAIQAIYAAGLSETQGDQAVAGEAGLRFFSRLFRVGNLSQRAGNALSMAEKTTPIVIRWDYSALADRDKLAGRTPIKVVVPRTGVVAATYVQAISATARHPNAAKLWMEYLYSDEGQIGFLRGYCNPIRYRSLLDSGAVPSDIAARLPPPDAYDHVIFPDPALQGLARKAIVEGWHKSVGAEIGP